MPGLLTCATIYCMEEERSYCRKTLRKGDTTEVLTALGLDKKTIAVQKLRDIFKNASIKYTGKSYVVLIGVENQSDIQLFHSGKKTCFMMSWHMAIR